MSPQQRPPQPRPARDMVAVAVELGVIREILGRLENEVEDLKGTVGIRITDLEKQVDAHALHIDRQRTASRIAVPVLMAIGAVIWTLIKEMLPWLKLKVLG